MKKIALIVGLLAFTAIAIFLLLSQDDAHLSVSTDIETYAVQPVGSEESFNLLLETLKTEAPYETFPSELIRIKKTENGYEDELLKHSELIRVNYVVASQVLQKLKALDRFEAIGDTTTTVDSEIVRFQSIRSLINTVCFYTELSYINENESRSIDEIVQLHSIISKWTSNTRPLVHTMICIVALNQIRSSVELIFPHLDASEIDRLMAVYSNTPDYTKSLENALYSEYCMTAASLDEIIGESKGGLEYLLFKRNKTLNIYAEYLGKQLELAKNENWNALSVNSEGFEKRLERFHPTNWGGWTMLAMSVPGMNKTLEEASKAESKDFELLNKLQQDGAGQRR